MKKYFKYIFDSILYLLFPHHCVLCQTDAIENEKYLCFECLTKLPKTNFNSHSNNILSKVFNGRLLVTNAASYLYYSKGSIVKKLLSEIKYNNKQELAFFLGEIVGKSLQESNSFTDIDIIIPMPIHLIKLHKRGYNQALLLSQGISKIIKKPIDSHLIYKIKNIDSQTKKSKLERIENVSDIFEVNKNAKKYNHILIVDDVVTTGASIDILGNEILKKFPNTKISIACLAFAVV